MLIAIAVFCTLCEAVFTAMEVAMGAVSRARLRSLVEAERLQRTIGATSPTTSTTSITPGGDATSTSLSSHTPVVGSGPFQSSAPHTGTAAPQTRGTRAAQRAEQ